LAIDYFKANSSRRSDTYEPRQNPLNSGEMRQNPLCKVARISTMGELLRHAFSSFIFVPFNRLVFTVPRWPNCLNPLTFLFTAFLISLAVSSSYAASSANALGYIVQEPNESTGVDQTDQTPITKDPQAIDQSDEFATLPTENSVVAEQLVTLGSLNSDGKHRYLATFSTRGATLVRLELNARDHRGNYVYRDLEHFGGYLGKLELTTMTDGLRVGCAGEGTPAAVAGIRAGDFLRKFNDVPITSRSDFRELLKKTKTGEVVRIEYVRQGSDGSLQTKIAEVTLSDQPLEMLAREVDFVGEGISSPPSFRAQLRAIKSEKEWVPLDPQMMTGVWEFEKRRENGNDIIDFHYNISEKAAEEFGLVGPIKMTKRFSLPILSEEQVRDLTDRSFDVKFEVIVQAPTSTTEQMIGLEINGPTGATTEGWWYQNKIHGSTTALFYIAGARDIVSSTAYNPYKFKGCPQIVDDTLKTSRVQFIIDPPLHQGADPRKNELKFLSVDTQYFNLSLLPVQAETNSEETYQCYSAIAYAASSPITRANARYARQVDCSFVLFDQLIIPAGGEYRQQFEIFAGPKKTALLSKYGLENTRVFGWFGWFSQFLCWLLSVLYWVTFKTSYGLAIILLTVIVRLAIYPLSRKAAMNAQMMQLFAPELKAIAEKYKDDLEKRGLAQRELFRKYKYNPAAGCLPAFLQIPILIGLYKGLSVDIALRDQSLIPGLSWCSNLAAPDKLFYWKDYLWSFLGNETGWLGPYFNILPIITIVLFLIQQKMFMPPPTDEQQRITQKIMTYMMVFMGVLFFKVPAGLCVYFITSSTWGIIERKLLPKPTLPEDRVKEIQSGFSSQKGSASPEPKINPRDQRGERSKGTESTGGGGFFDRLREAVEAAQKKNATIVSPEKERENRERRKSRNRKRS
jgi:YidC/Oxa1 family membrane protein insertase